MNKKKKKIFILFSILIILTGGGIFGYFYLMEKNYDFREWTERPSEVKRMSIILEIERPFIHLFGINADSSYYSHITCDTLYDAVAAGAEWIMSMQKDNGRYNYWLDPYTDELSTAREDNLPRQIGTAYSMTIAFEKIGDSSYIQSAKKNIDYVLKYKRTVEPNMAYLNFREKGKLGSIGLCIIAMLKYRVLTGDTIYDNDLREFGDMILYLQERYGTGQYKSTYIYRGDYEYEKNSGWESNIYPGEAMLALVRLYKTFGDDKYINSISHAHDYYSKGIRWQHSAFWPWSVSAMTEAFAITGESKYRDFVYKMADRICYRQNTNPNREVIGSFGPLPNVFSSPSLEALNDAIYLAKISGHKDREEKYTHALKLGFVWLLPLQFDLAEIKEEDLPIEAYGGFRRDYYDPRIRIDNTQHSISAFAKSIGLIYH